MPDRSSKTQASTVASSGNSDQEVSLGSKFECDSNSSRSRPNSPSEALRTNLGYIAGVISNSRTSSFCDERGACQGQPRSGFMKAFSPADSGISEYASPAS